MILVINIKFILNFSDESGKHQYCIARNYNYTLAAKLGYEESMNNIPRLKLSGRDNITCEKRDFNSSAPQTLSMDVSYDQLAFSGQKGLLNIRHLFS